MYIAKTKHQSVIKWNEGVIHAMASLKFEDVMLREASQTPKDTSFESTFTVCRTGKATEIPSRSEAPGGWAGGSGVTT